MFQDAIFRVFRHAEEYRRMFQDGDSVFQYRVWKMAPASICPLIGGFYPSEKYQSQLGSLFPLYGKIKHQTTNQSM